MADAAAEMRGLGQVQRVVDTFVAPSATFRDILRSTAWWLPFLLLVVASVAMTFAIDRKVGFDQVVETQVHMNPSQESQLSGLTPEARANQMHGMTLGYRYSFYFSPVFILMFAALGSLVLWGSFNFGLGARTTYGQWFCLWMYCALPRLVGIAVTIAMILFGGAGEGLDITNPVGTNVGYYFADAAPWVRTLLSFADVLGFWVLGLLSLGGAVVGKVKLGQAVAVVVGWWLLIVLVRTAFTIAFS